MRSRLRIHHRHDEESGMDRRKPRDVDLAEDADRADLAVLAGEGVVAEQDRLQLELRSSDLRGLYGADQRRAEDDLRSQLQASPEGARPLELVRALLGQPALRVGSLGMLLRPPVAQEVEDHRGCAVAPPRVPTWPRASPRACPVRPRSIEAGSVASALGKEMDSTPLPYATLAFLASTAHGSCTRRWYGP